MSPGRAEDKPPALPVIDHVGLEVADLDASVEFYDALFARLGIRKVFKSANAVAYGKESASVWIVQRGRGPAPSFGHLAIAAYGRAAVDAAYAAGLEHGGSDCGGPGVRPQYGKRYYAAYLLDPDGYRVELVSGAR